MKMNKRSRLFYGVGVNDADYKYIDRPRVNGKRVLLWRCPFFTAWSNMLMRVYSKAYLKGNPTYVGVKVCEEWHTFSKFKSWMEKQDWEGKQLDKDLLGDGKLYSPETCCFLTSQVNNFISPTRKSAGGLKTGVYIDRKVNKFASCCIDPSTGKSVWLGYHETEAAAHDAWRQKRIEFSKVLADGICDPRAKEALLKRYM